MRWAILLVGIFGSGVSVAAPFAEHDLVALSDDVWVDPAVPREAREALGRDYRAAAERVAAALGPWRAPRPRAIVCATDPCRVYFTGPAMRSWTIAPGDHAPGATYVGGPRTTIAIVNADERTRGVMIHEMVHVEAHARARGAFVPAWFHEGLAATLGDEPRCVPGQRKGIDDLRRLDGNGAWAAYTNQRETIHDTYCQARAEIEAFAQPYGKTTLLYSVVLDAVARGIPFFELR